MADIYYSERSYIKSRTSAIGNEKLNFKGGARLADLSIGIEDNATLRKVRRIVEKRVCQDYYRAHNHVRWNAKYHTRHIASNTMRNLYGYVPEGFRFCSAA